MMTSTDGIRTHDGDTAPADPIAGKVHETDAFGRIVRLLKDNERLSADLKAIHSQIGQARAYLAAPDCHLPLALATLTRLKSKHSGLLALLRANRIEALRALANLEEKAA